MNNLERIKKGLEENEVKINENGDLIELDSMKFIECIISLEEEFNVEIPYELLDAESFSNINTIQRILLNN